MSEQRERRGGERRSERYMRPKYCRFCTDSNLHIDYKDFDIIRNLVSDRGKIRSRRVSGLCAKHQRKVANEVKKARFLALLPYTVQLNR